MGYILVCEQKVFLVMLCMLYDQYCCNVLFLLLLVYLSLVFKLMGDEVCVKVVFDDVMQCGYGYQVFDVGNYWWSEWLGDYGLCVCDCVFVYVLLLCYKVMYECCENLLFDLVDDLGKCNYYFIQECLVFFLVVQVVINGIGKDDIWKIMLMIGVKVEGWSGSGIGQQSFDLVQFKVGVVLKNEGSVLFYFDVMVQGYLIKLLLLSSECIVVECGMFMIDGKFVIVCQFIIGEMFIVCL